jgi:hypothetical protein
MSSTGWFDKFTNTEIKRNTNSNGVVSYEKITTTDTNFKFGAENLKQTETKKIELLEVFKHTLTSSKKHMTPELKQVIDDLVPNTLNETYGITEYDTKTPLGHAIDESHIPGTEYLLSVGANPNIYGPNQHHILQELLGSNATDKRTKILEMVLEKLEPRTIKLEKNYNDNYFSMKYLVPLINSNHFSNNELKEAFETFKPKEKKILVEQCEKMSLIALEIGEEEYLSEDLKDLFFF